MAAIHRNTIVVAMGAGALGGPDALRLLLAYAGRGPLFDILIAVFVIAAVTAPALGTMLLARFLRKPRARPGATRAGGGVTGAAVADPFAKMTLALSLAVAFLVSASLLLLPLFLSGDLGPLAFAFAALSVGAGAALVRGVLRPNAHGTAPATEHSIKTTLLVSLTAFWFLLFLSVAVGILDAPAQRLLAFAFNNPLATVPVGVAAAAAAVTGTTLLALFFYRAQNVAATVAPLPATERLHQTILLIITPFAVAFFLADCLLAALPVA